MTIYYVDPATGNDANNGLSWATPFKTLLNGPTAALLGQTDSDEIRIAKSPDPVSIGNCTWTNNSHTVAFPGCSNILVDNCDSGWTAGLVTPTYSTTFYRTSTASVQTVLSATNGKICHKTLTSADYSAHSRITFWVNFGTAVNYSASCPVELHLCSDTAGNTTVIKFTLPRYYYPANYWVPVTLTPDAGYDMTSATAIQAITLRTSVAVTNTIRIDNINVIKSASDATSLSLNDVITLNDENQWWFSVSSLNGTNVDIQQSSSAENGAAFNTTTYPSFATPTGDNVTATTIKRVCFSTAADVPVTTTTAIVNAISYTNIANWPATKTYIGGWNTATDTVDGETWFDGGTGYGYGVAQTSNHASSYSIANISAVRYATNFILQQACSSTVTNANSLSPSAACVVRQEVPYINIHQIRQSSWSFGTLSGGPSFGSITFSSTGSTGSVGSYNNKYPLNFTVRNVRSHRPPISLPSKTSPLVYNCTYMQVLGANMYLITTSSSTGDTRLGNVFTFNNILRPAGSSYGLFDDYTAAGGILGQPLYFNINGVYGTSSTSSTVVTLCSATSGLGNVVIDFGTTGTMRCGTAGTTASLTSSGATLSMQTVVKNARCVQGVLSLGAQNSDFTTINTQGDGRTRVVSNLYGSTIANTRGWELQSVVTRSGTSSWRFVGATSVGTALPLGKVAVKGGSAVTISAWTNIAAANCVAGIYINDIKAQLTTQTSTSGAWTQLTITYTPIENGVVDVFAFVTDITANDATCYFDDLEVSQA